MCADEGVGVAVLKVGASERGRAAAAAHTGAVAGDHRVFRALMKEAGAAWAADVHELLELAKALAVRRRAAARRRARDPHVLGRRLGPRRRRGRPARPRPPAACRPPRSTTLRERLPAAATVANPLDYTAMIWGEVETLRDLVRTVGEDPAIGHVLVFYDRPPGIAGHSAESWDAVEEGILAGAAVSPVPVMVAATLPELLDDEAAWRFCEAGVPAIAGFGRAWPWPLRWRRLRASPGGCGRSPRTPFAGFPARWLAEHEAKELLRRAACPSWLDGLH